MQITTTPDNEQGTGQLTDLAERINTEHRAAENDVRSALKHAIKAGQLLIEAKDGMPHGSFGLWLKINCAVSPRQATTYMKLARGWSKIEKANRQRATELSIRGALKLITDVSSTVGALPPAQQGPVLKLADKGRSIKSAAWYAEHDRAPPANGAAKIAKPEPQPDPHADVPAHVLNAFKRAAEEKAHERFGQRLHDLAERLEQINREYCAVQDEHERLTDQCKLAVKAAVEKAIDKWRSSKVPKGILGVGVRYGHEALNHLTRIPKDDPERQEALEIVENWIETAEGAA